MRARGGRLVSRLHPFHHVRRSWAIALVLLAGCPGPDTPVDVDGGVGATSLVVTWGTSPPIPGPVGADLSVHELHITYSSVRLLGDAAPGDARTTRGQTELEWSDHEAPVPISFATAPPGLYSQLQLGVGGSAEAFAIEGRVRLGGTWIPYEIEDEAPSPVSLPLGLDLRAGMVVTIPVELDVAAVLAAVPFSELPVVAGHIHLDRDDPAMGGVRAALAAGFHVGSAPPAVQ